jgi:hypothetical protein
MPTSSNSLTSITKTNRVDNRQPSCSPKTRRGGSRRISPSCRSWCASATRERCQCRFSAANRLSANNIGRIRMSSQETHNHPLYKRPAQGPSLLTASPTPTHPAFERHAARSNHASFRCRLWTSCGYATSRRRLYGRQSHNGRHVVNMAPDRKAARRHLGRRIDFNRHGTSAACRTTAARKPCGRR